MGIGRLQVKPRCPGCQTILDGFTSVSENSPSPEPGSLTMCVYCRRLLIFTEGLALRFATGAEVVQFHMDCPREAAILDALPRPPKPSSGS
jgi:hypothetical protein